MRSEVIGLDAARHFGDLSPDGVFVIDADGLILYVNDIGAAMIGRRAAALEGRQMAEMVHPDDLMLAISSLESVESKRRGTPIELRIAVPGDPWRLIEIVGSDCRGVPGVGGILCTARDLTERRMWEVAGGDTARLQQILQHAPAIVMALDPAGTVLSVNGALGRLLGHDPSAVVGRPLHSLAVPGAEDALVGALAKARRAGATSVEVDMRHARRPAPVPIRLELVDLTADPIVGGIVVTGHDVSDLQQARLRLEHLASHDPLTGLPNRNIVDACLRQLIEAGRPLAVCYVDLDGFKAVNDTHGHQAGDELLVLVARRLVEGVAEGDLVARLGGDEFVVVCPGVETAEHARHLAARLERTLATPFRLVTAGRAIVQLSASVGATLAGPDASPASLLAAADRAMYLVKEAGDPQREAG